MEEIEENQIENYNDESEELNLEIQDENRKIIWQAKDFSIREFLAMEQDGDLVLQPEYQRKYVMDATKASRLIESILMDVPIPVVYLAEEQDGTYSVIDGQQRLTSFISFMKGHFPDNSEFKLKGLKVLSELNKSTFSQLEKLNQTKVKTTTIHTVIIKKESEEDIKFEIFERLNTGAIKLNQDELRNSVYRGTYIKLLAELENNEILHSLIRKDNYKKRMVYRGMLLRFFAFSEKTYLNYKPSMKQFLNKELRDNQNLDKKKAKEYSEKVSHCLELARTIFGNEAFRKFTIDDSNVNGKWSNSINTALFEIQMCGFLRYSKNQIIPHSNSIRESMIDLLLTEKFIKSISVRTNDRDQVETRFRMWFDRIEAIVGNPNLEPRIFPFEIKKNLFNTDSTCKICGQIIQMLDDAEVDHIIPYSKGGKTTIENAQIAHRFCNRSKSDGE
jgi:hypothetical protein